MCLIFVSLWYGMSNAKCIDITESRENSNVIDTMGDWEEWFDWMRVALAFSPVHVLRTRRKLIASSFITFE